MTNLSIFHDKLQTTKGSKPKNRSSFGTKTENCSEGDLKNSRIRKTDAILPFRLLIWKKRKFKMRRMCIFSLFHKVTEGYFCKTAKNRNIGLFPKVSGYKIIYLISTLKSTFGKQCTDIKILVCLIITRATEYSVNNVT